MKIKYWLLIVLFQFHSYVLAQQPPPPGDGGDGALVRDVAVSLNYNYMLLILGIALFFYKIEILRVSLKK